MQKAFAHFLNVIDSILLSLNFQCSEIMNLPTRSWIECTPIEQDNIFPLRLVLYVIDHSHHTAIELIQTMVLIV